MNDLPKVRRIPCMNSAYRREKANETMPHDQRNHRISKKAILSGQIMTILEAVQYCTGEIRFRSGIEDGTRTVRGLGAFYGHGRSGNSGTAFESWYSSLVNYTRRCLLLSDKSLFWGGGELGIGIHVVWSALRWVVRLLGLLAIYVKC